MRKVNLLMRQAVKIDWIGAVPVLFSLLFWVVLALKIPASFSQYFHLYSPGLFLVVLALYYLSFRLPNKVQILVCFGMTMVLFALPLSYMWTSGFSDNGLIGGLLPYKDARNYYFGANLILNGLPVIGAQQATERPLFPGFLASVLLLTGHNLKLTIAVIVQLMGIGFYLAVRQIKISLGILTASLYAALLYFYINPWIGYIMSETLGFALGCFGFTLICLAALKVEWVDLFVWFCVVLLGLNALSDGLFIIAMVLILDGGVMRVRRPVPAHLAELV